MSLVAAKRTVDRILISIILWDDHTTKLPDSPRILMWPCHNKAELYGEADVILLQTEPAGKLLKIFSAAHNLLNSSHKSSNNTTNKQRNKKIFLEFQQVLFAEIKPLNFLPKNLHSPDFVQKFYVNECWRYLNNY